MKKIFHKNGLISTLILAVIVLAMMSVSVAFSSRATLAEEANVNNVIDSTTLEQAPSKTITVGGVSYYRVDTAAELKFALRHSTGDKYLLMQDFTVSYSGWVNDNSEVQNNNNFYGMVLNEKGEATGGLRTLRFAPSSTSDTVENTGSTYVGLFGVFGGTLNKLKYVYSGKIDFDGSNADSSDGVFYGGGLCGIFRGQINDCQYAYSGTLNYYANSKGSTIFVGGIAGSFEGGKISDSVVAISGSIVSTNLLAQDQENKDIDATNCKQYVGGIAGYSSQNGTTTETVIESSTIGISATLSVSDVVMTDFWDSLIGFAEPDSNDDSYIFPVGGIFAGATQAKLTDCSITVSGSLTSSGGKSASKEGAIAGGIIGITIGNSPKIVFTQSTYTMSGSLNVSNSSIKNHWFETNDYQGIVYQGGIIGKMPSKIDSNTSISNIVIYRNSGMVKASIESNKCAGGNYYGMLCGYGDTFNNWNGGNIWVVGNISGVRMLSTLSGSNVVANNSYGYVHSIRVYGGGYVSASFETNGLIFYAYQSTSPFYGWYNSRSNMESDTKYQNPGEVGTKNVVINAQTNQTVTRNYFKPKGNYTGAQSISCLFLTTEIKTAGNMVQFANEMNAGYSGETAYDNSSTLNFPWVSVKLVNDITFNSGISPIGCFKGTFDGQGHTITFASSSKIVGNGKVAIFRNIEEGASFVNTNIVFAGDIYAGKQDSDSLDGETYAAVLAANNKGVIANINLEISQASVLNVYGSKAMAGGLVCINSANGDYALRQINVTIEGKIKVIGSNVTVGGLVASNDSSKPYTMINLYAKGEIVGSMVTSSGSSKVGGLFGDTTKEIKTENVVVNIRDYSNYNNSVLMNSCKCNQQYCDDVIADLEYIKSTSDDWQNQAKSTLADVVDSYAELHVASRSQASYDDVKVKLDKLSNLEGISNRADLINAINDIIDKIKLFDCSAVCSACSANSTAFALVGYIGANDYLFSNTWVIGSYSQFPDEDVEQIGVGTKKLYFLAKGDSTEVATKTYGLNLIYVKEGNATCNMDISSIDADNIVFTISLDTTKVFTGWYTDFANENMVELKGEGFKPGSKSGAIYYSSVIDSVIADYQTLERLAKSTNAGQTYEGITFRLGDDIVFQNNYVPIGTVDHPFMGTFDGKGYSVTISAQGATGSQFGLFGCIGVAGQVKQVRVIYTGSSQALPDASVFGGIAAYNYGVIGQSSTSNKITVTYDCRIDRAVAAGGIVGINYGTIQNAEVIFEDNGGAVGQISVKGTEGESIESVGTVGGVTAINKADGLVKNIIVRYIQEYSLITNRIALRALNKDQNYIGTYAGGIVGFNQGAVYSCVVESTADSEEMTIAKAEKGKTGVLIGYNGGVIDSLWALYSFGNEQLNSVPYGHPLICGDGSDMGNTLVKYGKGSVSIELYANNDLQPLGGSIIFKADEGSVPFYNYTSSLTEDKIVSSSEGGSGQNLAPKIGDSEKSGLSGKTFYAVFVRTEIRSTDEYISFAESINGGFKAYANYIVNLSSSTSIMLDGNNISVLPTIGNDVNRFYGSFNGNGYTIIYQNATSKLTPVFGVIGENSTVQNLVVEIRAGSTCSNALEITLDGEIKSVLGFLAGANFGTIKDITINSIGSIYSETLDYVGGVVGYNAGEIYSTTVTLGTQNNQGQECAGTINGDYAGGIVGYNVGIIGSDRLDSVKLIMNSGDLSSSVRGITAVGGIVGFNGEKGILQNVNAKISGTIGTLPLNDDKSKFIWNNSSLITSDAGSFATNVGAISGINQGSIPSAICYTYQDARFPVNGSSQSGNLGGIAGLNKGSIGLSDESVKVFFNTDIDGDLARAFGGIVGKNEGNIAGCVVELKSSVKALSYIGGAVGHNQSGTFSDSEVTIAEGCVIAANGTSTMVGGIIGYNLGLVYSVEGVVEGTVGADDSGFVGGFVGMAESEIRDSYVILNNKLKYGNATVVGLFAGDSTSFTSSLLNSWAVASNSDPLPSCGGGDKGYNVLKIVGNSKVNAQLIKDADVVNIKFTANNQQGSTLKWYSDISKFEGFGSSNTVFIPDRSLNNATYHVCYFDLEIDNVDEFLNIYQFVNAYDLFNGVMFRLNYDLVIDSTIQPIGTKQYPFKGVFEGAYHTITIENGGIAGNEYSGLFGYVDDCAIIRNFILEIKEDVIVGSGMSKAQGALAGRLGGLVENVGVNLLSAPYSLKSTANVGALAGEVSTNLELNNVWCIVYNSAVKYGSVYENGGVAEGLDLNIMAVLGIGKYTLSFEETTSEPKAFLFTVTEGFEYYDNIYYSISDLITITEKADPETLGKVDDRPNDNNITYLSRIGLKDKSFTTSFIDLVINDQEDFIRFAYNVNTYGDNGAKFTFNLTSSELVVDLSMCPPVGTKEHPFTGILDGSAEVNGERTNACYTIRVKGDLNSSENEYSGLFGYVGKGGVIRNLIVRADNLEENSSYQGQTVGDKKSIYTGYLASYLEGTLENVAVVLGDDTKLYNINQDSLGGIVGVVGKGAEMINTWLILPENSEYNVIGGYYDDSIHKYYDNLAKDFGIKLPNVIYRCGKGLMDINLERVDNKQDFRKENLMWQFSLTSFEKGDPAYGFVKEGELYSSENKASEELISKYIDDISDVTYLALFLDDEIDSYEDLVRLASLTSSNRRYEGVEFIQKEDIVIEKGYTPIGGRVNQESSGTMTDVYKYIEFIGIYNGNGKKIIIPEEVTIDSTYAGIFGILGKNATVKNLYIEVSGSIGVNNGDSATSTIYAGSLAGEDRGATLENIIVVLNKSATLSATMDTGRVAYNSSLQYDVHGAIENLDEIKYAKNVWVLAYNNKYNYNKNNEEQRFYDGNGTIREGSFNGGINVITVIAAGELTAEFADVDYNIRISNLDYNVNAAKEWYTIENGIKVGFNGITKDSFTTDVGENCNIIYASFLESEIGTIDSLKKLAEDTNNGYDLYGLTFELISDIEITSDSAFIGIGGNVPFNAIFDGNGHSIILSSGAIVKGKYAGIFGNVGQDGIIKNVVFVIDGQLGYTKYTDAEVQKGNNNTSYAGALAYIQGKAENVIIIGTNASLESLNSANQGIAFGYDVRNLHTNVWLITSSENAYAAHGEVTVGGESGINVMQVIGMGELEATLYNNGEEWFVKLANAYDEEEDYSIKGWYSNYAKDNQLSEALGVNAAGTSIVAGDNGYYIPKRELINRTYEVVIINTIITDADQLISIAKDVNIGGYTYENTSFSIGRDIVISSYDYQSIGTEKTMFMGSFSGSYNGNYHTIYLDMKKKNVDESYSQVNVPLFAYNKGTITDLSVQLNGNMVMNNSVVGVICQYNYGVISNSIVSFDDSEIIVYGSYVGGIAGINQEGATIANSIVIVPQKTTISGKYAVGGQVGQNEGYIYGSTGGDNSDFTLWETSRKDQLKGLTEYANVTIKGRIAVENAEKGTPLYVGGGVGVSQNRGYISGLILRLCEDGSIYGDGDNVAVGGIVGRSSATIRNTVVITEGEVSANASTANVGYFAGSIQGSANNSWLVYQIPSDIKAIGNGYESVNSLQISGNGVIDAYIDSGNNIIFTNITPEGGASIDGWYVNNGVQVNDSVGNVYDNNTFRPNLTITGRTVNAVFINTEIRTVYDLVVMANTVNGGLFSKNLTFRLMNDITITKDDPLTACIGIYTDNGAYGFKHEFLGQNYTITIESDGMLSQSYMGIFGYATSSASIKDLNVVYASGIFGSNATQAFGGIVGINAGEIDNCQVTIESSASLIGVAVGGISGSNQGKIDNCKVLDYGSMEGTSVMDSENKSPNAYVGGISGSNSGDITNVEVILGSGSELKAVYKDNASGATYVGGISGSNSRTIEHFYITIEESTLQALSRVSAYAGGVVGSNIGSLEYGYVKIVSSAIIGDVSGGIAGANSNYMRNIVVMVDSASNMKDSAVYQFHKTEASVAINVWTYNDNSKLNSSISQINNMTYKEGDRVLVVHNDYREIVNGGNISFYASFIEENGITMYADAHTDFFEVLYNESYLYYGIEPKTNGNTLVLASPIDAQSISVKAVIRREFNSQSELKMLSKAVAFGYQPISGELSIGSPITITDDFTAIGTEERPLSSNITFNGGYNEITFASNESGESLTYGSDIKSLFGYSNATIKQFAVRYEYSLEGENSAGICYNNSNGEISNCVVYLDQDVTVTYPIAVITKLNKNNWVIGRMAADGSGVIGNSQTNSGYGAIVINGRGDLVINVASEILRFTPTPQEDGVRFAGFSDYETIRFNGEFQTEREISQYNTYSFTAEFINSKLYNKLDLLALNSGLAKGYGPFSEGEEYTLEDNIEVSASEISSLSEFLGVLDGNGYTLTISGAQDNGNVVLTKPQESTGRASYKNIVFDIRTLDDGMFLFDIGTGISLTNVAVLNDRTNACLNDTVGDSGLNINNVFLVTRNEETFNNANDNSSKDIGIIHLTGERELSFSLIVRNNLTYLAATANEADEEIFTGWYLDGKEFVVNNGSDDKNTLILSGKGIYRTEFISTSIGKAEDVVSIQKAVSNGFEFEEVSFFFRNSFEAELSGLIGDDNHSFKGSIDGNGYTLKLKGGKPLFDSFRGSMKNLIIDSEGVSIANSLSESVLENVVFISSAGVPYISAGDIGTLENVWMVSKNESPDTNANYKLSYDNDLVSIKVVIENSIVTISAVSKSYDNFIVWKNDGSVLVNECYNYISSANDNGSYSVTATDTIKDESTFKVANFAIQNDYSGNIELGKDLVFDSNVCIEGYSGLFNGNGYSITINSDEEVVLFRNGNGVKNLRLIVNSDKEIDAALLTNQVSGIASINTALLEVRGDAKANVDGKVDNLNYWIVERFNQVKRYDDLSKLGTANLLAVNLGDVSAEINGGIITFTALEQENDGLSYVGYHSSTVSSTDRVANAAAVRGEVILAYYVDRNISSIEAWNNLQDALISTTNNGKDLEITVTSDIEYTSEWKVIESFSGVLNGDYHSIVVRSSDEFNGLVTLGEEGIIKNLAVVARDISASKVFSEGGNIENCWVIDYSGKINEEVRARVITVEKGGKNVPENGGEIEIVNQDGFIFRNKDLSEYKLRNWKDSNGNSLEYKEGVFYLDNNEYNGNVIAEFFSCYTIYVNIKGIDGSLKRPNITETTTYWSNEIEEQRVDAEATDGYLFLGYEFDNTSGAITYDGVLSLVIDVSKLTESIEITANYILLTTSWDKTTYGDYTQDALKDMLSRLDQDIDEDVYNISYSIAAEGDTVYDESSAKYLHAGSYIVSFIIKTRDESETVVGRAAFGYTINKRQLQFSDLTFEKKAYDTTPYATLLGKQLVGFISSDAEESIISTLDFSNVKFVYIDPDTMGKTSNAGNGYYIMIEEGSYLSGTSDRYYLHVDYELPEGIIYRYIERENDLVQLEPYTFNIEKADLILSIKTITVDYYKQFLMEDGKLLFDINDYFESCYDYSSNGYAISGSDKDIIRNAQLLVVEGDSIVDGKYIYNLKQPGDYSISVLTDALSNYNPKLEGTGARFRVVKSKVEVVINDVDRQYGDKIGSVDYSLYPILDGSISETNLIFDEKSYDTFKQAFGLNIDYQSFVKTYFNVDLVVDGVYKTSDGKDISYDVPVPVFEGDTVLREYGLIVRFTADNKLFDVENYSQSVYDKENRLEYLIKQNNVLKVLPRSVVVEYTGISGKVFAAAEGEYQRSARAVNSSLVKGDLFNVSRVSGETVGTYNLSVGIQSSTGEDISRYYSISFVDGVIPTYTIRQREIKVQHGGSNYYYGDDLSSMKYYINVSDDVLSRIVENLGSVRKDTLKETLSALGVTIKLGYFGEDIQNVGTYNCSMEYSTANEQVANSIKFVLDENSSSYTILPRKLIITTLDYEREYDTTKIMSFDNRELFTVDGLADRDSKYLEVVAQDYSGVIQADAGMYSFRPIGLKLQTKAAYSETQYGYLVSNYVIDKIYDGKYTIKAVSVPILGKVGYYDESECFVEPDSVYFGNMKLVYHFTLEKALTGYLGEMYKADNVDEMTDKAKSEWLIKNLRLAYKSIDQFPVGSSIKFALSSDNTDTVALRSSDSNIKIEGKGSFYIDSVIFVASDILLESQSGSGIASISFKLKVLDAFDEREIDAYEFINEVKIYANESFAISDGIRIKFNVISYSEGDKCTYSLSTQFNNLGVWEDLETELLKVSQGNMLSEAGVDNIFSDEVVINYTRAEKLMAFIKNHTFLFVLCVAAVVMVIGAICALSIVSVRRRRIANAAEREINNELIVEKLNSIEKTEVSDTKEKDSEE